MFPTAGRHSQRGDEELPCTAGGGAGVPQGPHRHGGEGRAGALLQEEPGAVPAGEDHLSLGGTRSTAAGRIRPGIRRIRGAAGVHTTAVRIQPADT